MTAKKTTIALGVGLALAGGLYLGSHQVQAAATCPLGGDVGPAVAVQLAKTTSDAPAAKDQKADQDEPKKPSGQEAPTQGQGQGKDDAAKTDGAPAAPPAIPRIAPDEGC